jgi:phosphogluconate dehydratase
MRPCAAKLRNNSVKPIDTIIHVTDRIRNRSAQTRAEYETGVAETLDRDGPRRSTMPCANVAHVAAACPIADKTALLAANASNLAIVTAYNDIVSAHQPFERFPDIIRREANCLGAVAQVAGGVPAMCDGITQGREGMELSLFSRDVIAMSTAVALSHDAFDAALYLGVCDKIVPGLVMGALAFGHLPAVFVPGGPMPTGMSNSDKVKVRQSHAEGKVGQKELLESEARSYHAPGTCTFYGTANSNQMLMEIMGLHLPGSSFVNPNTSLRDALTRAAVKCALEISTPGPQFTPISRIVGVETIVNGIIGLLVTGGSTNHTIHLVAMARAAGIIITWDDFSDLSDVIPLVVRAYPNGPADINQFHAAGGMRSLIASLLDHGLLHADVDTIVGKGLDRYRQVPVLLDGVVDWRDHDGKSSDDSVLRSAGQPFQPTGGLRVLTGNLGRSVIKVSAVKGGRGAVTAPAKIFETQEQLMLAFKAGELDRDFVAVLPFQGPKACGMPELHKLSSALGVLQDRGFKVALVTDGRMSGASGKVPAAIHVSPEAADGGPLALVRDGDMVRIDPAGGTLEMLVDAATIAGRQPLAMPHRAQRGIGREFFANSRRAVSSSEDGATFLF